MLNMEDDGHSRGPSIVIMEHLPDDLSSDDLDGTLNHACDTAISTQSLPFVLVGPRNISTKIHPALRARKKDANTGECNTEQSEAHKAVNLPLNKVDMTRKRMYFDNLCQSANTNPW